MHGVVILFCTFARFHIGRRSKGFGFRCSGVLFVVFVYNSIGRIRCNFILFGDGYILRFILLGYDVFFRL